MYIPFQGKLGIGAFDCYDADPQVLREGTLGREFFAGLYPPGQNVLFDFYIYIFIERNIAVVFNVVCKNILSSKLVLLNLFEMVI